MKSLENKGVILPKKLHSQQGIVRQVDYKKIFQDILYTKEKVDEHDDRIKKLEEKVLYLEEESIRQNKIIAEKDKLINRLYQQREIHL